MENEKLIEIIKVQNELIWLLCDESGLAKNKPHGKRQRIEVLIRSLRDFNEQVE